jgi:hypothetical protein
MRNAMVFMALMLFLGACAAPPKPTPTPPSIRTFAVSTASEPTQSPTAEATSTPTIIPSATLEPSLTPTFIFGLPSKTPTPSNVMDCQVLTQSPANGTQFNPGERFTAGWQLLNNGAAPWLPGSVVFTNLGGTKMYFDPVIQLKQSVSPGQSVAVTVDMKAPSKLSSFTSYWGLRQGKTVFCPVHVTILVQ